MLVKFYQTKSENKVLNKVLTNESDKNCQLIYPLNLIRPQLKLSAVTIDNYSIYNYVSFTFGGKTRYYYVTNFELQNDVLYVTLLEDSLMSWKEDILNSKAHILRNANTYNVYLHDNMIVNTNKVNRTYKKIGNGFTTKNTYVLTIGG